MIVWLVATRIFGITSLLKNMETNDLEHVIDLWNLTLGDPPKVYFKPVSALYVGWWARNYSVGHKGKLGIGEFLYTLAVKEAIAHASERNEILKIEQMRRRALGLPCDEYATLCAIAIESGLFKDAELPVNPQIEGAEILQKLKTAAGSSSKLQTLIRQLEEVLDELSRERERSASKGATEFLQKLAKGTATLSDAIVVADALGERADALSRLVQQQDDSVNRA